MMKKLALVVAVAFAACSGDAKPAPDPEVARWEAQAQRISIVRDDWGIPHIHGKTDGRMRMPSSA
jgi:acyl-homoserine lactone acylase PvdQ